MNIPHKKFTLAYVKISLFHAWCKLKHSNFEEWLKKIQIKPQSFKRENGGKRSEKSLTHTQERDEIECQRLQYNCLLRVFKKDTSHEFLPHTPRIIGLMENGFLAFEQT